jgi:signal transduction histidine kinase
MNVPKLIANIILTLIAAVITLLISWVVPKNQFAPYRLELDSTWAKEADVQDYLVDLNNDHHYEIIRHNHINKPGHSLELIYNNQMSVLGISNENSFTISRFLRFADVNQDGILEMIFISVTDNIARLFIMGFDFNTNDNSPVLNYHLIEIDSVSYQNNVPDVVNYEILANGTDIYFDLQAGYYVQPRNVYKYNFQTKKLIKTQRSSIVNKELELLKHQNQDYLLAKNVVATANTFTHKQAEKFRTSNNADSVKIYRFVKNITFEYGDFSSYLLLYNANLEFAFKPVEFFGWTNFTLSDFLWNDTIPQIISLTNNPSDDKTQRKITLCSLRGDIVKQLPATENYDHLYADRNTFALHFNQNLDIYSSDLKLEKRMVGLTFASGFYDLTPNTGNEFIAFENNELIVFSENFNRKTSFGIAQEFAPYPENNHIEILNKEGKTCFLFNTHLFYYLYSYEKNELAILKYPFYLVIFLFWSGILFLLMRFNARRLVKEKQQLEKIVSERTQQLQTKNIELASQKEEIQVQAEEITQQYERLEKLDRFKESLTHALVHDLKNPLSQIMLKTNNLLVNQSARKMLRLITNMLDVEKYENTGFRLNKEIHSLLGMFEEVKTGQEPALREKNLKLSLHFDDYLVQADKEVMIRVFDNLLSNAIRFSPQNRSIDVFAEKTGSDIIQVSFKNYGDPIPEEALPFIFDKYWQFETSDSSSYRTTGLGLTFCKMAVEAHGGNIIVRNQPDGVVFTLDLAGNINPVQTTASENETSEIVLTAEQKAMLRPFFDRLNNLEVHQVSDILQVLEEIPGDSGNINLLKQQIRDAAFATNAGLYHQIIT